MSLLWKLVLQFVLGRLACFPVFSSAGTFRYDLATANYEKSLQLDLKNQNAMEMLKKLGEAK